MADPLGEPRAQFRFKLQIEGITAGWFTECSGLTIEREVIEHTEGGVNDYRHRLPGPIKRQSLTLKRGLADELLWEWLQEGLYEGQVKRRSVSVFLYNTDRTVARQWDLAGVYPTKWTGSEFKADGNQVVIETLELSQHSGASAPVVQRAGTGLAAAESPPAAGPVDLQLLANKIYHLLKQELKTDQERVGRGRW